MYLIYLNLIVVDLMVEVYGNRTLMVSENVVQNGLEGYISFHITNIDNYVAPSTDQYHIRHQFILSLSSFYMAYCNIQIIV